MRGAMHEPRPGPTTCLIIVKPAPSKYDWALIIGKPVAKREMRSFQLFKRSLLNGVCSEFDKEHNSSHQSCFQLNYFKQFEMSITHLLPGSFKMLLIEYIIQNWQAVGCDIASIGSYKCPFASCRPDIVLYRRTSHQLLD